MFVIPSSGDTAASISHGETICIHSQIQTSQHNKVPFRVKVLKLSNSQREVVSTRKIVEKLKV